MTLSFERLHTGIDDDVGYYVFFFTGWQDVGGGTVIFDSYSQTDNYRCKK